MLHLPDWEVHSWAMVGAVPEAQGAQLGVETGEIIKVICHVLLLSLVPPDKSLTVSPLIVLLLITPRGAEPSAAGV